jgi:hypothetical protein
MNEVLIVVGIAAACIVVGLIHWMLARLAPVWPGAIIPTLWVMTAIYLVATGGIDSIVDVGGLILVSVVLARIWHEGRQKRAKLTAPDQAEV